jgi:hypothetical protein
MPCLFQRLRKVGIDYPDQPVEEHLDPEFVVPRARVFDSRPADESELLVLRDIDPVEVVADLIGRKMEPLAGPADLGIRDAAQQALETMVPAPLAVSVQGEGPRRDEEDELEEGIRHPPPAISRSDHGAHPEQPAKFVANPVKVDALVKLHAQCLDLHYRRQQVSSALDRTQVWPRKRRPGVVLWLAGSAGRRGAVGLFETRGV